MHIKYTFFLAILWVRYLQKDTFESKKDIQYNCQKEKEQKDKQLCIERYTENWRSSNTIPTKNMRWTLVHQED